MFYHNSIKKELKYSINQKKSDDILFKEITDYEIVDILSNKDAKMIYNVILENHELFLFSKNNDFAEYYGFHLFDKTQKICTFTINGYTKLNKMFEKLFVDYDSFCFYNIQNKVFYDTKNENIKKNILRMFNAKNILFIDWNILLNNVLKNKRIEMLLFYKNKFYLLKMTSIFYCQNNISDYYSCTNIPQKIKKCDLCCVLEYEFVIENDFVFNNNFNKFCANCFKIVTAVPSTSL